mgnify:CR=1 FL=1
MLLKICQETWVRFLNDLAGTLQPKLKEQDSAKNRIEIPSQNSKRQAISPLFLDNYQKNGKIYLPSLIPLITITPLVLEGTSKVPSFLLPQLP